MQIRHNENTAYIEFGLGVGVSSVIECGSYVQRFVVDAGFSVLIEIRFLEWLNCSTKCPCNAQNFVYYVSRVNIKVH